MDVQPEADRLCRSNESVTYYYIKKKVNIFHLRKHIYHDFWERNGEQKMAPLKAKLWSWQNEEMGSRMALCDFSLMRRGLDITHKYSKQLVTHEEIARQ